MFVDSEPALHCCIRAYSSTPTCDDIAKAIAWEESSVQTWCWFARVPSESNPADLPSRGRIEEAAK
eukprot:1418859-Amphidinium_carterae.1